MIFKPKFISTRAINMYAQFLFISFTVLIVLLVTNSNFTITFVGAIIGALVGFRLSIYHLLERIEVTNDQIVFKTPLKNPQIFDLNAIDNLYVMPFFSRYGSNYLFIINEKLDMQKRIERTKSNSFRLHSGWKDGNVSEVLNFIKHKKPQVNPTLLVERTYIMAGKILIPNKT